MKKKESINCFRKERSRCAFADFIRSGRLPVTLVAGGVLAIFLWMLGGAFSPSSSPGEMREATASPDRSPTALAEHEIPPEKDVGIPVEVGQQSENLVQEAGPVADSGDASLAAALDTARHQLVRLDPDELHSRGADFFAANSSQQMRAWFTDAGVELASGLPPSGSRDEWKIELNLTSFGRPGAGKVVALSGVDAQGTRIESSNEESGLTQWFENRGEGIEHGFTVEKPPLGEGGIEIVMGVGGTARPSLFVGGDAASGGVRFTEPDGTAVAEYVDLKAWDATGRTLDAEMSVRGQAIVLHVDDEGAHYPLTVDPLFVSPQARLTGGSKFIDAYFGESVSVSVDLAIVGARLEDTPAGANAGAAYVFLRNGAGWDLQGKLTASDGATGDEFGKSVSIDGTTALVGAPFADPSGSIDAGSAYVFVQSGVTWSEEAILPASFGASGDQFGRSVALSSGTAMVGASNDDTPSGTDAGSVSFYTRSGVTWPFQQKLESLVPFEELGFSVALDGDLAVVGAHLSFVPNEHQAGRAYVLSRSGGVWTPEGLLQEPTPSAAAEFGYSVAISGETVLVGTLQKQKAYVFARNGGLWGLPVETFQESVGLFGISVALDGDTAVVGAEYDSTTGGINAGGAYVYVRSAGVWSFQQKLAAQDSSPFDLFGHSVAISGETILVGAAYDDTSTVINAGSAYFFERTGTTWNEQTKATIEDVGATGLFGFSVALSGETAVVGAGLEDTPAGINAGAVYVFVRRNGSIWGQQARLVAGDGDDEDRFGSAVAVDGDLVIVGAEDDNTLAGVDVGSAYFFTRSGDEWTERQQLSGGQQFDYFGDSVALDGTTVVVGAPYVRTFVPSLLVGSAFVYEWDGSSLTLQDTLLPEGEAGDLFFGIAVAISGETVLVGAPTDFSAGASYVFTRSGSDWTQQQKLVPSDGLALDQFGTAVDIDGDIAVIGARSGDTAGNSDAGSAYVFERSAGSWNESARLAPTAPAADDFFGWAVALSGTTAVVGAPSTNTATGQDVGTVYVFQKAGSLWNQQASLGAGVNAASTAFFGAAIAVEDDTVVVGTPGEDSVGNEASGSVYVFLVGELPEVTLQPISRTVPLTDPGTPVSFTANVSGYDPIEYQWRKDGVAIPGEGGMLVGGTTTYTIPETAEEDAGIYDVIVTNVGGVATSAPATLTVNALSAFEQLYPGAPPQALGFVLVTLTPGGLGGWRFQGEQLWRASGVPAGGLATGDRVIEFRPIPGYLQPPPETVGVVSGGAAAILDRTYYETPSSGNSGLSVTLKPESITLLAIDRAQWRLLGEDDSMWRDSESTLGGIAPGTYLIECKPVAGRATPAVSSLFISENQTATPTITYFLEDSVSGVLPSLIPFETVTTDQTKPYAFVGQLRSSVGSSSGFVVMPRVVATAGHVVFDDGTLAAVTDLQWLFQQHSGTNEPAPQPVRGFYIKDGYALQRALENTPGSSSPASQNLDVAAVYFMENAARGGFGGYLASDASENEFLLSSVDKMLVGYPIDGIDPVNQGRMHATPPTDVTFTAAFERTYTTNAISSSGGASGGPLCVQFENGAFYPAAIYLGGSGQTVVRAIDSTVIDLFSRAGVNANGGTNNNTGGISHGSVVEENIDTTLAGGLQIMIEPAEARNAGAGWLLPPEVSFRSSGSLKVGLSPGEYIINFNIAPGFAPRPPESVIVVGGQILPFTFTYAAEFSALEIWRFDNFGVHENTGDAADGADPDKDGRSNIEEYVAGTDPNSALDFFQVDTIARSAAEVTLTLAGKTGRTYTLQRDVGLTGTWTSIASEGPLTGPGSVLLIDPSSPAGTSFYRVEVTMP